MSQIIAHHTNFDIHTAPRTTPTEVTAARVIAIVQGALVLAAGVLMVLDGPYAVLGIVSAVEGAARIGLGIALRRGARRVRIALLVLAGLGVFGGVVAKGLGLIGAAVSVVIIRCLQSDEAKRHLAA